MTHKSIFMYIQLTTQTVELLLILKKIPKKFEFIRFLYTFATSIVILNAFLFSALRQAKNLT